MDASDIAPCIRRSCGRSVLSLYNQVRPHSAHRGLSPAAVHIRSAGARLRNPGQLRRSPATIAAPEPL
jgi:hypothetical protein